MHLIDANNAAAYLRDTGRVASNDLFSVQELAGGVSNVVLYVSRPTVAGGEFVLKQARGQLRVEQPWFCGVERIWREVETLRICEQILSGEPGASATGVLRTTTPRILWEDRENYCFAMTAAPPHRVWKADLLAGHADEQIASACGTLLGQLHAGTWHDSHVAERLADRTFFVDLRVDPYYRRIAEVHPQLRPQIEELVKSVCETSLCLVHGDFSPKNLLVYDGGLMLVDCEVGHFGDPAFDVGFFLSHLCLKAIRVATEHEKYLTLIRGFWQTYLNSLADVVNHEERTELVKRALTNLAGCVLARVDGKSPVEYLTDLRLKEAARRFSYRLFLEPYSTWPEAEPVLHEICESIPHAAFWQNPRP